MDLNERTLAILNKIQQVVLERKETYSKAMIGLALNNEDRKTPTICFAFLNFLSKQDRQIDECVYDYGNLILVKKLLGIPEALAFIENVSNNKTIQFGDWKELSVVTRSLNMRRLPSYSNWGYIYSEWPSISAYFGLDNVGIPSERLAKFNLPLYPNGMAAIDDVFTLNLNLNRDHLDSRIEVVIPDYRARIKNLRLAGNRVGIDVEVLEAKSDDLVARFYCKTEERSYTSDVISLDKGKADYVIQEEPLMVEAQIFSKLDQEPIDSRSFDYRYPRSFEGILIEHVEDQLIDFFSKGESITLEFKRNLTEKNHIDFMKTIVAFANTNGGMIFIGVDDNTEIVGFSADIKDKVTDLAANYCDPPIELQVDSRVPIKDKEVALIKVPEGENKPYLLRNRGIYVRKGGTDRQITRIELDDLYSADRTIGHIPSY